MQGIPHVIVVNDDPSQLELISHLVKQEPAQVSPFCSATDALAHLSRLGEIDLIVTDLHMPGIDGWRFCHLLRSPDFPSTNKTPILIVSATLSREDVGTVPADIGADAFLSMPYTPRELRDAVHNLLHRRPSKARPTALIVACEGEERRQIADGFDVYGYDAHQAGTNQEAIALFQEHRPTVIVLDHHPPEIVGSDLLPTFKADPRVVVLATTDGQDPERVIALTHQGADSLLVKPYDIADLVAQVDSVQRGRTMLRVETAVETLTRQALRNARRIQRLNDCFLALGTDHYANIHSLTQTAGELLNADLVMYDHLGLPKPYTLTYRAAVRDTIREDTDDRARCLNAAETTDPQPAIVRNIKTSAYKDAALCARYPSIQTYVECPVLIEGRQIGSLCVAYAADYTPLAEELNLIQLLARVIGRQEQLDQRERELTALNKIGRTVTSTLTLDEVLTNLRREVRNAIGAQVCSVALIDPISGELVFRQADDPFGHELIGYRLPPKQGIAGLVAHTGESILVPDVRADPRFFSGVDEVTGFTTREIICAPLVAQDRTIGVIEILNKQQGAFTTDDVRLIESVAAQIASALENARLHEATQHELTERIRAEQALRESTTRLQTFVDVTPDLIYLKNRDLRYLLVNKAFAGHWGLPPTEIIGQTDVDFMPEDQARAYALSEQQVIEEQTSTVVEEQRGSKIYELRCTPVIDEAGHTAGIAGVIRDITERKRLQEQLIREQKEESILTLATGIVHDFNNALVGIVGNIDILRVDLPGSPEIDRTLKAMELSAHRMVDLTSQLLAYAGGGMNLPQPLDLNALVHASLNLLQVPSGIAVHHTLTPDLWAIRADPNQIKQVLLNLLTNASEAMAEQGGVLSIETKNMGKPSAAGDARSKPGTIQGYVCLTITDTGHGMDQRVKQHLFEPFFSTKFLGRGLGLAAAQGIVRDHDGRIEIESSPGKGTTVHVYLPRYGMELAATQLPSTESGNQKAILVVEDESVVRSMIQRALMAQGYEVIVAQDGDQALRFYDERVRKLDAVLLDLGLPGTNGKSVLGELRARDPDILVLLTSGYNAASATKDIEIGAQTRYIQKPFSLKELQDSINSLLATQAPQYPGQRSPNRMLTPLQGGLELPDSDSIDE